MQQFFPDDPKRQWFQRIDRSEDGQMTYVGIDHSLQELSGAFHSQGPFDGVLGFSQGAALSLIID